MGACLLCRLHWDLESSNLRRLIGWRFCFDGLMPVSWVRRSSQTVSVCVGFVRVCSSSKLGRIPFLRPLSRTAWLCSDRTIRECDSTIKTRNFHLINAHTVKVPRNTNPSCHMRPRLGPCGKLVCQSGDSCRTPTQWHAQRERTAAYESTGK